MIGLGILDTVIGVVFVFLLVSMLVTIGNELISAILMSRAKWLRIGLNQLLGSLWASRLYAHPLVYGTAKTGEGPSYIPSRSFANVIMDLIRDGTTAITTARTELEAVLRIAGADNAQLGQIGTRLDAAVKKIDAFADAASSVSTQISNIKITKKTKLAEAKSGVAELISTISGLEQSDARTRAIVALQALLEAGTGKMDDWSAALTELGSEIDTMGAAARRMRDDIYKLQKALPATVGEAVTEVRALIDAFPAASVRAAIDSIPIERVRSQLLALFDDAENDIEKFKKNVELWFNNAMDRVGGWYKRKTQWVAFFLALGVATGMNVDTLAVIRYLQTHPTESAALVAEAQSFAKENPTAVQGAQGAEEQASSDPDQQTYTGVLTFGAPVAKDGVVQLKSDPAVVALAKSSIDVKEGAKDVKFAVKVPVSTTTIKATITATGAAQGTQTLVLPASLPAQYRAVQAELGKLGLPIGWVREPNKVEQEQRQEIPFMKQKPFVNWGTLFYHALGWFITALAATLGAPFWFDTLNRLISIRSAGKSPEEAPKAPKKVPVPREPGNIPAPATGTDHGAAT